MREAMKSMHEIASACVKGGSVGFISCSLVDMIFKTSIGEKAAGVCLILCAFAVLYFVVEYLILDVFGD